MAQPWRTTPLPADWPQRRARTLERDDHRCTATHHHQLCDGTATDVDHIIEPDKGGTDDDHNLTSLNHWCHRTKTASHAGRTAAQRRSTKRPPEPHPGLT